MEAIEYYTKLEEKLKEDYKREKEKVNEKPLGMAFVTFHNEAITAMWVLGAQGGKAWFSGKGERT